MFYKNTNAVQSFLRTFVWIISFVVLTIFSSMTFGMISTAMFETPWILMGPALLFNAWLSGIISGTIYILPEWERLVLLKLGKFVGIKGPGFFFIPPFVYSVAAILDHRIKK